MDGRMDEWTQMDVRFETLLRVIYSQRIHELTGMPLPFIVSKLQSILLPVHSSSLNFKKQKSVPFVYLSIYSLLRSFSSLI